MLRGYGLYAPNYHSTSRPGLGAVCTSSIWPDVLMDITSYDSTALATTIYTSAGENGALVFATAFDGTAATSVDTSIPTRLTNSVTSTTAATITSSAGTSISVSGAALALPAVLIVLLL
ncbi:hypothetical protein N7456_010373 [Penicillium angulare]|uniref:Uncharacterized protein n=1 Tax=Penicillium angulare TaxID=116970 RepID=A0A9W9F6K0_9EURO|nr:hypothetical protein N7456_010373 [Penicillium angulare]